MATLSELRALASKRHDAANSKVSRLNKQGVKVAGTEFDPRTNKQNINRYNRKQLESYVKRINNFTSRDTQFVAGRAGSPIPREDWVSFQRAQTANNIRAEKYLRPNATRILPTTNISVEQRLRDRDAMDFNVLRMGKGVSNLPYTLNSQQPTEFSDANALKRAESAMRTNLKPKTFNKRMKTNRRVALEMLDTIGEAEMIDEIKNLSNDEFDLLWNLTSFPDSLVLNYENIKNGNNAKFSQEIAHDHMLEAKELTSWAKKQQF